MVGRRLLALSGLVTVLLFGLAAAHAEVRVEKKAAGAPSHTTSIERLLLPDAIADRIRGSGLSCRSFMASEGRHKTHLASLRLVLTDSIAVRAGIGMARLVPAIGLESRSGLATAAAVSFTVWRRGNFGVDVDVSATRAGYSGGSLTDGTVMLAFRGR